MAAAAPQQPVSAQLVGNAFVQQYYHILHHSPGLVHRFYQDISKLGRPEADGSVSTTTTMQAINEKIVSLNYGDFKVDIKSVDAQESFNDGVQVLVTGFLMEKEGTVHNFAQTFFLAPQDKGYFVLNDMFQYVDNVSVTPALVNDVVVPIATGPVSAPLDQEKHVSEQSTPSADEAITGEVYNPSENGDVSIVEEEVHEAVGLDETPDESQVVVESSSKIEEMPKKSYASIVMDLKESAASFSPPVAARKVSPKKAEPVSSTVVPATTEPAPTSESVDNGINQEGEAEGYSIYIRGLPMNATDSMLEEVFKKFGRIKSDGIQVRSPRFQHQGVCFGFVEYEDVSSVEKAVEASPVTVGGREVYVEQKRSSLRGNNRGRSQPGRGSGFRNEGGRGWGNYGGGRGYNNRGEFNGRSEFVNRGGSRGGSSSNRNGFQRSDNYNNSNGGGRMNHNGGMVNGSAKHMLPRVSATA